MKFFFLTLTILALASTSVLFNSCGKSSPTGPVPTATHTPVPGTPTASPTQTLSYSNTAVTVLSGLSYSPYGMSCYMGDIWTTPGGLGDLYEYTVAGASVTTLTTYNGSSAFGNIYAVNSAPDGTVYVCDWGISSGDQRVEVFSSAGVAQTVLTGVGDPLETAVNSSGTTLFILTDEATILTYSISGTPKVYTSVSNSFNTTSGAGKLSIPAGIALDSSNNVYVTNDPGSFGYIVKYGPTGGGPITFGSAVLTGPCGIAVDSAGNLLVDQTANPGFIQEFNPSGSTYTAGVTFGNSVLKYPEFLTLDTSDNIYVANTGDSQILEFPAIP